MGRFVGDLLAAFLVADLILDQFKVRWSQSIAVFKDKLANFLRLSRALCSFTLFKDAVDVIEDDLAASGLLCG